MESQWKEESGYYHQGSATAVLHVELKQKDQETARGAEVQEKKAKRLQLDVEVSKSNSNGELKLIDFLNLGNSSENSSRVTPHIQQAAKVIGRKIFSCSFCQRKFLSSQALGGHQNGHRREKNLRKRGQVYGYLHHNYHHHCCSGISSCPHNHPYGAYSMMDNVYDCSLNTRGSIYRQPSMRLVSIENYHLGNLARSTPSSHSTKADFNLKRGAMVSPSEQEIRSYPMAIGCGRSKNRNQYDEQKLDLSLKL